MITKKIKIQIKNGLEARPVAVLVQVASQFNSSIYVEAGDKKVNAKSIMGMMALGLDAGEMAVRTEAPEQGRGKAVPGPGLGAEQGAGLGGLRLEPSRI